MIFEIFATWRIKRINQTHFGVFGDHMTSRNLPHHPWVATHMRQNCGVDEHDITHKRNHRGLKLR
jgi:hypothetical protein